MRSVIKSKTGGRGVPDQCLCQEEVPCLNNYTLTNPIRIASVYNAMAEGNLEKSNVLHAGARDNERWSKAPRQSNILESAPEAASRLRPD